MRALCPCDMGEVHGHSRLSKNPTSLTVQSGSLWIQIRPPFAVIIRNEWSLAYIHPRRGFTNRVVCLLGRSRYHSGEVAVVVSGGTRVTGVCITHNLQSFKRECPSRTSDSIKLGGKKTILRTSNFKYKRVS